MMDKKYVYMVMLDGMPADAAYSDYNAAQTVMKIIKQTIGEHPTIMNSERVKIHRIEVM